MMLPTQLCFAKCESGLLPPASVNPRRPTTARREMNLQSPRFAHRAAGLLIIARISVCVGSILVRIHGEVALSKKREIDVKIASCPVCHRPNVPIVSVSSGHKDVVRDLCIQHSSFIPFSGNGGEKLHRLGLTHVI